MSEFRDLMYALVQFRDARDWAQFHDTKNLAVALSIEAAELNKLFLWKDTAASEAVDQEKIKEELTAVFAYARFWNSNKVLLLYPGEPHDSGYQPYPNPLDLLNERTDHHRCKTVHIQVLEHQQLDKNLAQKILHHLVN